MAEHIQTARNPFPWKSYYELCKPNVVFLIAFTALAGMLLAVPGMPPLGTVAIALLGISLGSAAGAAVNHVVDHRIDALMARTMNRPVVQGDVSQKSAVIFALLMGAISMFLLVVFVNTLTAVLTFISMIGYAVIYTMYLKRSTPHNIVIGGAAGATPPLLGWTAITGEVNTEALLLFLIIFIWTPPHFWALAIKRRADYARADVPMLPLTHGVQFTKEHIVLYTLMLFAVTLMPFIIRMSGLIYLAGAVALGIGFIYHAVVLYREKEDDHAMKTFSYSILYLGLLFSFLLLDHYAREFIHAFFA
ncbi:MAG: heme o synthase [Pseudomonadales bacterium]|nr:heme o synthase [Pseudomonadales bacterium]